MESLDRSTNLSLQISLMRCLDKCWSIVTKGLPSGSVGAISSVTSGGKSVGAQALLPDAEVAHDCWRT